MRQGEFTLPGMITLQIPLACPIDAPPKGAGASGVSPGESVRWTSTRIGSAAVLPRRNQPPAKARKAAVRSRMTNSSFEIFIKL